ncbi:MAG TPA: LLM class F420-dependent oxidoreductase [Candidatus Dormibacteraeota bacterium]|nr:LLM class F420-dependent oxidoreductase [Candidatus Dormibacteraeota bacterium]
MELGRIGIWSRHLWGERATVMEAAAELEDLGYGALWFPNAPSIFERARDLLDATRRVVVAPGIASIWTHTAADAAAAHHALTKAHPGRFLLGLGVSHAHLVDREEPGRYSRPLTRMREYLDRLDAAPTPVPVGERILAALGPRMLELARDRSAGAHPYLGTVEHTRRAREVLGSGPLLAPELAVVLETDRSQARSTARQHLTFYLRAPNYTNNWLKLGFTPDDLAGGGSDRLVDEVMAWGSTDAIRERIAQHHEAGADHVCLQVVTPRTSDLPLDEWRTLAAALSLKTPRS